MPRSVSITIEMLNWRSFQHSPTCFEVEFKKSQARERCQLCHIFVLQDALMHTVVKGQEPRFRLVDISNNYIMILIGYFGVFPIFKLVL